MIAELIELVKILEKDTLHNDMYEYVDLLRSMAHKYFELDKQEEEDDDSY
jgi:hypothetical protein